ncbi:hypothetical protein PTKIN_Ptkin19aG0130200 [Pterospermum kingtungense]
MNEKTIIPNGEGGFGVIEIPNSQAQSMNCQFGIKEMGLGLDGKQAVNYDDNVPLHGVDLPSCKVFGLLFQMIIGIPLNEHLWDNFFDVFQAKKELDLVLQVCWQIWKNRSIHRSPKHLRWSPPPQGSIKVNVDVAWNPSDKCAVSSCVVRDDSASIPFCAARKDDNVDSVLYGELLDLRFGCELVLFRDLSCVLLESDSCWQ